MTRSGFLDDERREKLIALARDGSTISRVTRRANAVVLLDAGWSASEVANAFLLDDDTIRGWRKLYEQCGVEGLTSFDTGGSSSYLSAAQEDVLKAWAGATLPCSTRLVGAWIEKELGLVYESRSGLIALLHRLGFDYHKPEVIPRKLDVDKQKTFIAGYENLLNSLPDNENIVFIDAVHPTHAARPAGCWAPKAEKLAVEQTSGRQRINIHGAIDLETGQTRMIEAITVDAASTIRVLESIELAWPLMVLIHVYLACLSRQRAVSSRQARTRLAGAARLPDQAPFHPGLLPAPKPDRATVGRHAQECHAQQDLRDMRRVRRCNAGIFARKGPAKLVAVPKFGNRQFSCHQSKGFSGYEMIRVYFSGIDELTKIGDVKWQQLR